MLFFNNRLDNPRNQPNICIMPAEKEVSTSQPNIENANGHKKADIEKLASLGEFTARIAHELNNPLDGILRYLNLALRGLEQNDTEKPAKYLNHCRDGLLRMAAILNELLEFSRSHYAPPEEPVQVNQIVDDAVKTISARPADTPRIRISRRFADDLPQVKAAGLFQVFCNIVKNAFDSMPNGGELEISTQTDSDGNIVVRFTDTGYGFDPKDCEVIFEPFFTTKQDSQGTGLGLAICRDIITKYGGHITAKNEPDKGSTFTVYLPAENIKAG